MLHAAPEPEALISRDAALPPIALSSASATDWRSSLLNRSLKRLGFRPRDAVVVSGVGGRADEAIMIAVYALSRLSPEHHPSWREASIRWRLYVTPTTCIVAGKSRSRNDAWYCATDRLIAVVTRRTP